MPDLLEEFESTNEAGDLRPFQEWDRYLKEGERMLWDDAPSFKAILQKRLNLTKQVGWLLLAFAAFLLVIPAVERFEDGSKIGLIRNFSTVSAIAGIGVLTFGPLIMKRFDVGKSYGISTDYAIILKHRPELAILRFPLSKIKAIELVKGDFDSVFFAQRIPPDDRWIRPWEAIPDTGASVFQLSPFEKLGFEYLEDGSDAYRILNEARDAVA